MVGWVNTCSLATKTTASTRTPAEELPIDTPAGQATAIALPTSLTKPFLLNPLQPLVALGNGFFTFEPTCVSDSKAMATCTGSMAA